MKCCIVAINASYMHTPLAAWSIYANTKDHHPNTIVKEYNINLSAFVIANELLETGCQVFIFSCYIWNIELCEKVAQIIKKASSAYIAFGGSEVVYHPQEVFSRCKDVDCILGGWGELSVDHFLSIVEGKQKESPDVLKRTSRQDSFEKTELSMEALHFAYSQDYLKKNAHRIFYYESSRGCPYRCSFCLSSLDKTLRYKSMEKVKKELQYFLDSNVRLVKFVDRTFNADSKRALQIIKFLKEHDNHITTFHFEIVPDLLDEALLEALCTARKGLFQLEAGLQSIHPPTLSAIKRKNDLEKIQKVFHRLQKNNNIHLHIDLIAGLPHETLQTFRAGCDYVYALGADMVQIGVLKVLKGAPIETQCAQYGIQYTDYPPYQCIQTQTLRYQQMQQIEDIAALTERYYNTGGFCKTLALVMKKETSMFDFFNEYSAYLKRNGVSLANQSRESLYVLFKEFLSIRDCEETALFALQTDMVCTLRSKAKHIFLQGFSPLWGECLFTFLNSEKNRRRYLPQYPDTPPKEIIKHVRFYLSPYRYANETILKEDSVLMVLQDAGKAVFLDEALFF